MKKITLLVAILFCIIASNAQVVSTFAGSNQGYVDGIGTAAQFNNPYGVCTDATGNVYVADSGNNSIRKITPSGVVSTFAGSPSTQFNSPSGVCIDASGNLYVADSWFHRIIKITPSGVVTTFAGGTQGSANGTGTNAQFSIPISVCTDSSGNIYVADFGNNRIRKITPSGVVTTFAGSSSGSTDGIGTAALFNRPAGVCTDASGNVYVADRDNYRIRKISPSRVVTTLAGSTQGYTNGIGTVAKFNGPEGICTDIFANIYVTDGYNHCVRKITPSGDVTTFAGSSQGSADGSLNAAQFFLPTGVCFDASGNAYVSDYGNNRIRKITICNISTIPVISISPSTATICLGQSISISATGGVLYSWSSGQNTSSISVNPTQTTTYTVTVTNSNGCTSTATKTVTVNPIPTITVSGSSSICNGQNVTLTASGGSTYLWSNGSTSSSITVNPSITTTYTVIGTNSFGCEATISKTITVKPIPVVTLSPNSALTCSSLPITLTANGGTGASYLWSNGSTSSSISAIPSLNGTSYSVTATNSVGCSTTVTSGIFALTPTPNITPSNSSICLGQSITLTASGGATYQWSNGATTPNITVSPSVTTTYSVITTSPGGCTASTTKAVTVNPLPTVTFSPSTALICRQSATTLTASGGASYLWSNGSTSSSITVTPTVNGTTYSVTATNSSGCSTNAVSGVIALTPTTTINTNNSIVCQGQSTDLSYASDGSSSYLWSNGATTGSITVSPSVATTYTVTATSPVGCTSTASKTITIYPTPTTSISADGTVASSATITNGSSVQLQINGSLNATPNIQWTPAIAISSTTVTNPVVYPSATTTYTASFNNINGCPQTTSITINVTPQPTIGNLSITSSSNTIGLFDTVTVDVQLTNATDLYSLYMKLKGNAAVSQYLDYSGYTASSLLGSGSSVISTPPTITNGIPDFGITKVGANPGYSGSGLFYSFRFVTKNISIPTGTNFCFYLDDVSANNSSGIPCGLNNQGQYCYTFTNQVNVWPGDLNKSNSVSTADILPIGYFYNSTGPARPIATIQWNAQPATLWGYNHSSQNGNAYKVFADSNGDGVINNADQAAIGFNMNQVHARHANPKLFSIAPKMQLNTLTVGDLIVTPNNTVINAANLPQTVTFTVNLNNTGGLNALYGISVNLIFDDTIFDLNTASIDYTGSIFGTAGSDCLVMNYNSATAVSVGLTRYANAAINGQGLLFKVTLQTKSILSSLTQTPVTAYVDSANNQVGDTLVIQDAPVTNFTIINNLGIDTVITDEFLLYPNPTNDILYLTIGRSIDQINNLKLIVFNVLGQIVDEIKIQTSNMEISTRNWGASGVYFVKIVDDSNNIVTTKKIILKS